jgi:hypothetical protein
MLLLAGNGHGVGALKVVRGLYERAVAITYLSNNPEKAFDFLDFAHVEKFKAITAYTEAYPNEKTAQKILADARVIWESVKSRFPRNTWSGLDFVAMAKTCVGLDKMLDHAYYLPRLSLPQLPPIEPGEHGHFGDLPAPPKNSSKPKAGAKPVYKFEMPDGEP